MAGDRTRRRRGLDFQAERAGRRAVPQEDDQQMRPWVERYRDPRDVVWHPSARPRHAVAVDEDRAVLVGSEDQHVGAGFWRAPDRKRVERSVRPVQICRSTGDTWRQPAPEGSTVRYTATPIPV